MSGIVRFKHLFLLMVISFCFFYVTGVYGNEISSAIGAKLILNLSTNLLSVVAGNKTSFVVYVKNVNAQAMDSVEVLVQGVPSGWLEITPKLNNIPAGDTISFLVTINVPSGQQADVYELTVNTKEESNTEVLSLITGNSLKEVTDLLIKEFENAKLRAEDSLLVDNCLDITVIRVVHSDALYAYQRGLEEYSKENYTETINYIEYAIPLEHQVMSQIEKMLLTEFKTCEKSRILIPPFYDSEDQLVQAKVYFDEKDYQNICAPIGKLRKYITVGIVFWFIIVVVAVLLITILVIFYRRKKIEQKLGIMERVRERLEEPEAT